MAQLEGQKQSGLGAAPTPGLVPLLFPYTPQVRDVPVPMASVCCFPIVPGSLALTWDALLVTVERHCVSPSVAHVGAGRLEPVCSLLWFPPALLQVVFHDVAVLTDKLFPIVEAMQKHFSAGSGTYYSDSIFFLSVAMHQIMPKGNLGHEPLVLMFASVALGPTPPVP